ncbi:MAG TPA: hypothetical protein VE826_00555 [Dongiaceae bacterium]|nr:hypothetical protein [Dongiaceae bacterium]
MRRHAVAALAACLAVTALASAPAARAADSAAGRWAITTRSDKPDSVQLRLEYQEVEGGSNWSSSWSFPLPAAEAGIPMDRLRGPIGPVSFQIQREPGTFNCTGSAGEGSGAGQFTYAQSARFDDALAARGAGRPTYKQSLELALANASLDFVDKLRAASGRATVADVVKALQHGVSPRYLNELAATGYRGLSIEQLVRLRDHGVGVDLIRAMQAAGYRLSPDDLVRLSDHGVNEKYLSAMRAAGYTNLTAEQFVTLRDHGVTTKFVADMAGAGYKNLSADDLVALRDHGVNIAFVDHLKAHGYNNLSVRDLIRLRDSGF